MVVGMAVAAVALVEVGTAAEEAALAVINASVGIAGVATTLVDVVVEIFDDEVMNADGGAGGAAILGTITFSAGALALELTPTLTDVCASEVLLTA